MITRLGLANFKNFRDANLELGPLTVMVGTNASGKSNIRDAFRFLHGVSREYTLAEIIGEKWVEGGVLQWKGIRGGTREATYPGQPAFAMEITTLSDLRAYRYRIEVDVGDERRPPRVVRESLHRKHGFLGFLPTRRDIGAMVFDTHPADDPPDQGDNPGFIYARLPRGGDNRKHGKRLQFVAHQPVLSQIADLKEASISTKDHAHRFLSELGSMRFLDLAPEAMRLPSIPGQDILGDRGENLSSVLQAIYTKEQTKAALINWVRALTPLDVMDFDFIPDQTGKILVSLIEKDGRKTSAYSASDGTLRFLAMIAALLGPSPARFYFFEELENGIHPTRLHLLLQLIEQKVKTGEVQLVASSHSPQLLGFLSEDARKHASLIYRLEETPDARIKRIIDIPHARELLEKGDLAKLHASGWLEDAVSFLATGEAGAGGENR